MIEKNVNGVWCPAARQQPNGSWVDLRYNQTIKVMLIPLIKILGKLKKKIPVCQEIDKYVEFLFTSFDRKKLNGKLKTRNLKHNINNLKLKLEKQHALSFAIRVANTADLIATEYAHMLHLP